MALATGDVVSLVLEASWSQPKTRPGGPAVRVVSDPDAIPVPMLGHSFTAPWAGSQDHDYLLLQVAESLQLTKSQFEAAEAAYRSVSSWLNADDTALARLRPFIFPHGSVALGTTVKPRRGQKDDEYDVDCVCRLASTSLSSMEVYALVQARLMAHETYRSMLERKNRCLRLNYSGQFHIDILPGVPTGVRTELLVPDREIKEWTRSDPEGFAKWFKARAERPQLIRADAQPLPEPAPARDKPALAIAVQLVKRRRDMVFDGSEDAPRSILLTTLAARVYNGSYGVGATLAQVVAGMASELRRSVGRIAVPNPVNEAEDFAESLDDARYEKLRAFMFAFEREIAGLATAHGEDLREAMKEMFGAEPTVTAFERWGELLNKRRVSRTLTVTGAGKGALGVVSDVSATKVPRHDYFGA